jgi:hypothetical protein
MNADECRAKARLMRRRAASEDEPFIRDQYRRLAQDWEKLAAEADELERVLLERARKSSRS